MLRQPDRRDVLGARDHALLLYLYNSGSRADEAARLRIGDLRLDASPAVRILGKGNKLRMCPLWPVTAASLDLVAGRDAKDAVFINRRSQPLTRFGIHRVVAHNAALASRSVPSLVGKRVSPHTIRHYVPSRTMSRAFCFKAVFCRISPSRRDIVRPLRQGLVAERTCGDTDLSDPAPVRAQQRRRKAPPVESWHM